jgi:glutaredoxin
MGNIKVFGTTWCGDCHRAKSFMDDHNIDYEWTDVDIEPTFKDYIMDLNSGNMTVPTILFEDGSVLFEPTNEALAEKLSIKM